MEIVYLSQSNTHYPSTASQYLKEQTHQTIASLGNLEILQNQKTGLFCSMKCPCRLILAAHDLAKEWMKQGITVVSGFHSPIERECLNILLRGIQPIILCPARSIETLRIPKAYKHQMEKGRLLILSPFATKYHRISSEMAWERNQFVAALADTIFVVYAELQTKTEQLCQEMVGWKKPIYTFPGNENLLALGVKIR